MFAFACIMLKHLCDYTLFLLKISGKYKFGVLMVDFSIADSQFPDKYFAWL